MDDELSCPHGLLLDLDGTLVDTVPARIAGWREALAEAGLAIPDDELAGLIGIDGRRLATAAAARAGRTLASPEAEELDARAGALFDVHNIEPRPLPGVDVLLATAERHGLRWAVATSSRRENVAGSLAAVGLSDAVVFDGTHVNEAKPSPELLELAARGLELPPADCWAVGDAVWDVLAAKAAGITAACVLAGSAATRATLVAAGAALVVSDLADLSDRLDLLLGDAPVA